MKFICPSEKIPEIFNHVDVTIGFCECRAGHNCGTCKHKGAISKFKNYAELSVLPESDSKVRALYHYSAHGTVCSSSW